MIDIQNLSKEFTNQALETIRVLESVTFHVAARTSVAIKGPSGSGKSTLLGILAGLEKPTSGTVRIADTNLSGLSENELAHFRAKRLGFVFQQFHLLAHLTALQNVMIAAEISGQASPRRAAADCLDRVGLGSRMDHLPTQLSGGECQRVAIARAIVTKPKVLLCDEPTGSLDPQNADRIFELLSSLRQELDTTMILVTHDPALAEKMDMIVELERGRIKTLTEKSRKESLT